jgi:sugar-specific transcriptional regulator TrmB
MKQLIIMIEALRKIGLTEGEIKVYLALLELGNSTTWNVTKKSKISGSKVYEVLDRLMQKGLAATVTKNNIKYFEATSPERIIDYLDEKNNEINKEKNEIKKIIPDLILKQANSAKSEVKVFTGFEGAKNVWEDVISLKKGEEIVGWGLTEQPEFWLEYFNTRELVRAKKGIMHRQVISQRYQELYKARKEFPNTQFRFFQKGLEMPTAIEVWKNKTALFVTTKENPITIVIENKATADSFRRYFKILWESSKK